MKKINNIVIEEIARILAEELTGSKITKMFAELNLYNFDQDIHKKEFTNSTKWRRINESVLDACRKSKSATPFFKTIEYVTQPEKYMTNPTAWRELLTSLNIHLIYYGFKVSDSGKIVKTKAATSFSDAQKRSKSLNDKFNELNLHPSILKYANSELLHENYFHAILEASKGLLDRIRKLSGLETDGNTLVNQCFNKKKPIILIQGNYLKNLNEQGSYDGLKSLLNSIVFLYRNPRAHEPKLYDETSMDDAITAFVMISLANKKLDNCINVRLL